jgi:hypothetical protein
VVVLLVELVEPVGGVGVVGPQHVPARVDDRREAGTDGLVYLLGLRAGWTMSRKSM